MKRRVSLREMSVEERLAAVLPENTLEETERVLLTAQPPLDLAHSLIENPIGWFSIPLGVANHFVIDGKARVIPMAIEETSVIASACSAAKWIRDSGGSIGTIASGNEVAVQIHIPAPADPSVSARVIEREATALLQAANACVPGLVSRGGGFRSLQVRLLEHPERPGAMLSVDLHCDPCAAMGANLVTQAGEGLKPLLQKITGERIGMAIVSNLSDRRRFVAKVQIPGVSPDLGRGIEEGSLFAEADPYRAATHNKGIFNAIDAILIATGNDWRAVEASCHAWAARGGRYRPLSTWRYTEWGELQGMIDVPLPLGTVGGVTRLHPAARAALAILGNPDASELGRICAAAGLVQNLAALRALTTVGISQGHMALHAENLARAAGATHEERPAVVRELKRILNTEGRITQAHAVAVLKDCREKG